MIVYNSVTRDHRVLREAETLQAVGHQLELVGVPDASANAPVEVLPSGVRVHRVLWQSRAYGRMLWSSLLKALPVLALLVCIGYGLFLFGQHHFSNQPDADALMRRIGAWIVGFFSFSNWLGWVRYLFYTFCLLILLALVARLVFGYVAVIGTQRHLSQRERELMMRHAEGLFDGKLRDPGDFPKPRSFIPDWFPDFLLELMLEPLQWISGRMGFFVQYRYRARELANFVIAMKPDVVHVHDCIALPTGVMIKRALGIPLVYDAHEVYEHAAARRFGITDYYTRIHRKFLPYVDRFITINHSAARFYRYAHPRLVPATIIRNATRQAPPIVYDGRLHAAADLPPDQKILLYQGGYTEERGLPTIVRGAAYLPDGWTLVMMGWGPLAGQLRQIAVLDERRRRLDNDAGEKKVVFVPGAPYRELPLWTAGATIGIIPYEDAVFNHWICSPNKLWEFPNAGVPMIVQPFPELKKVVETYGCGWVLPGQVGAGTVANLIAKLGDEDIAAAQRGCRAFLEQDSWEVAYEGPLIALYESLAPGARMHKPGADVRPAVGRVEHV